MVWCKNLIIMEDRVSFRCLLMNILRNSGLGIHTIYDADIRSILDNKENSCLIIRGDMNLILPDKRPGNAIDLVCDFFRQKWKRLEPVIVYSYVPWELFSRKPRNKIMRYQGTHTYLQLPLQIVEFLEAIENCFQIEDQETLNGFLKETGILKRFIDNEIHMLKFSIKYEKKKIAIDTINTIKENLPENLIQLFDFSTKVKHIEKGEWDEAEKMVKNLSKIKTQLGEESV